MIIFGNEWVKDDEGYYYLYAWNKRKYDHSNQLFLKISKQEVEFIWWRKINVLTESECIFKEEIQSHSFIIYYLNWLKKATSVRTRLVSFTISLMKLTLDHVHHLFIYSLYSNICDVNEPLNIYITIIWCSAAYEANFHALYRLLYIYTLNLVRKNSTAVCLIYIFLIFQSFHTSILNV